jgi:hypothetical protein
LYLPPAFPGSGGILVLALPRANTSKASGLRRFVLNAPHGSTVRILFCYTDERLKPYAEASAASFTHQCVSPLPLVSASPLPFIDNCQLLIGGLPPCTALSPRSVGRNLPGNCREGISLLEMPQYNCREGFPYGRKLPGTCREGFSLWEMPQYNCREGISLWEIAPESFGKEFSHGKSLPKVSGRNFRMENRSRKLREGFSLWQNPSRYLSGRNFPMGNAAIQLSGRNFPMGNAAIQLSGRISLWEKPSR